MARSQFIRLMKRWLQRAARTRPRSPSSAAREIYRQALPLATRVELTEVHTTRRATRSLPPFDRSIWRETAREEHATPDGLRYSYVTLERR